MFVCYLMLILMVPPLHAVSDSKLVDCDHDFCHPPEHSRRETVHKFSLDIDTVLHKVSDKFLSFSIDTAQVRNGFFYYFTRNSTLIKLVSYVSPGYLRIGGTEGDRLIFKERNAITSTLSTLDPNNTFYMTDDNWLDICTFAKRSNLEVIFSLNVLLRKNARWEYANARSLIEFSAAVGLDVSWQLGNEPNAFLHTFNVTVSPSQLVSDFDVLRRMLNFFPKYKRALLVGPDVTTPYPIGMDDKLYMSAEKFLHKFTTTYDNVPVDAIAWHHYYLHSDAALEDFLSPVTFDSLLLAIHKVKRAVNGTKKPLWITESGSACGGGAHNISDRFLASLLFLDRLGLSAREGISVVIRHSLFSGRYSLLNMETLTPNPDWWVSYIYKRLVGPYVLKIKPTKSKSTLLRLYAHCTPNGTVVVFGINLSNETKQVMINTNNAVTTGQLYQLTAPEPLSKVVLLNGVELKLDDYVPPPLHYVEANVKVPFNVEPLAMFFLHLNYLKASQCLN